MYRFVRCKILQTHHYKHDAQKMSVPFARHQSISFTRRLNADLLRGHSAGYQRNLQTDFVVAILF